MGYLGVCCWISKHLCNFLVIFLLLMSSFTSLLSETYYVYYCNLLKFIEIGFIDHVMVYFGKYSMCPCKEWMFCSCWVLIRPNWLIMLIKSSISLLLCVLLILSSTEMSFEISSFCYVSFDSYVFEGIYELCTDLGLWCFPGKSILLRWWDVSHYFSHFLP